MNKLQKLARLIQFTVKLICFFLMFLIITFLFVLLNELSDGGLFDIVIIMILWVLIWGLVWDTKWENLFKNKNKYMNDKTKNIKINLLGNRTSLFVILLIILTLGEPDLLDQVINIAKNYSETIKCK